MGTEQPGDEGRGASSEPEPSLDDAKAKAREAAAQRAHKLGDFRWEMPMGGSKRYLIANCDKCGAGMIVRPDGTFGGTAMKQDCGTARAAAPSRKKAEKAKAPAAAPPPPTDAAPERSPDAAAQAPPEAPPPEASKETKTVQSKAKAKAKPNGAKKAARPRGAARSANWQRHYIFEQPVFRVLRWMGQHNFSVEQATAALKAKKCTPTTAAITAGLRQGSLIKEGKGEKSWIVAKLDKDQQAALQAHKK